MLIVCLRSPFFERPKSDLALKHITLHYNTVRSQKWNSSTWFSNQFQVLLGSVNGNRREGSNKIHGEKGVSIRGKGKLIPQLCFYFKFFLAHSFLSDADLV
jgi:hypothetical protein